MDAETHILLIHLVEGFLEGLKNGTFRFTEREGRILLDAARELLHPGHRMDARICNMTQACDYLGITPPTFRKYVREGRIPKGVKIAGFTEKIWNKSDIEEFAKSFFSTKRKRERLISD